MDLNKLKEPFPETDIEWRLQSCGEKNGKFWGKALAYITSRAVQDRLDEVCGPDNWKTSIEKTGDTYLCTLSIRVKHEDGTYEWISRTDGADATDIEPVKGGISGAIKRAAVHFGIGRYLYNLDEGWADVCENGKLTGCTKEKKYFKWNPPKLPAWALPGGSGKPDSKSAYSQKPKNNEPVDDPELIKQTTLLESWINDGDVLTGDYLKKAQFYIQNKDLEGIKRTIEYCKSQKQA
jgi:hypothetical protein